MQAVVEGFTQLGMPGLMISALILWIYQQNKELKGAQDRLHEEHTLRVADAKEFTRTVIDLQQSMHEATTSLAKVAETLEAQSRGRR